MNQHPSRYAPLARLALTGVLALAAGLSWTPATAAGNEVANPPGQAPESTPPGEADAAPAAAAPADPRAERLEAMNRLAFWIGEWEGSGWSAGRAGRQEFTIHESVQPRLGGRALLVQGQGRATGPATGQEHLGHDAIALVTWDPAGDRFVFRWSTAEGGDGESELVPFEDGWRWGYTVAESGVEVRFTVEVAGDVWRENGEVSLDGGATWRPMMAMELRRVEG